MAENTIRQRAYAAFQMYWMAKHCVTVSDISKAVGEYIASSGGAPEIPFSEFLEEVGFMGAVWPCYQEFLDNEYLDAELMHILLGYEEFRLYLDDRCESFPFLPSIC